MVSCISFLTFASQVLETDVDGKVAIISSDVKGPWIPMEDVCLVRDEKEVACGKVLKSNERAAEVQILFQKRKIEVGDKVVYASEISSENSPIIQSSVRWGKSQPDKLMLAFGALVSGDFSLAVPTLQLQYLVSKRAAIGVQPTYLNQTISVLDNKGHVDPSVPSTAVSALGVLGTMQFYSERHLVGFWLQMGFGPQSIKLSQSSVEDSYLTLSGLTTVGWRVEVADPLNVGMGIGALYLPLRKDKLDTHTSAVRLIAQIDVGLTL